MEPPITGHDAISRDESPVHNWRVSQLTPARSRGAMTVKMATTKADGDDKSYHSAERREHGVRT